MRLAKEIVNKHGKVVAWLLTPGFVSVRLNQRVDLRGNRVIGHVVSVLVHENRPVELEQGVLLLAFEPRGRIVAHLHEFRPRKLLRQSLIAFGFLTELAGRSRCSTRCITDSSFGLLVPSYVLYKSQLPLVSCF
jgi:hypothetical protein